MIDTQSFRESMSGVCAPVTVVTVSDGDVPRGATVSAFGSLSLDPPLISVALDRRSSLLERVRLYGRFGVNVLGHHQGELATVFASREPDRFARVPWTDEGGLPRLHGTAGWLACELEQVVEAGDHLLLFGLVHSARTDSTIAPLVYLRRTFGTHSGFARTHLSIADRVAACAR